MFTGIIEEVGMIQSISKGLRSSKLTLKATKIMTDVHLGDSIAVNGVCLTVTSYEKNSFTLDVMAETLSRTTLGKLQTGSRVNLERAMAADGRFGGHIVSGHIDGTGRIVSIKKEDNAIWYTVKTENKILRYVIEKGSIAIDGISLTVVDCDRESFRVSVIPHTAKNTILSDKHIGDMVNLENDCIGKYIEKLLAAEQKQSGITMELLMKNNY